MNNDHIREGDRIRATYEGVVNRVSEHGINIGGVWLPTHENFEPTIDIIAHAKPKPKVGDIIEGAAAYNALPHGSVVQEFGGNSLTYGLMFRTNNGWVNPAGNRYGDGALAAERTLVYLPGK